MHSGYPAIFSAFIPDNSGNETWGTYHGLWDMVSMMFIGMALFRWGFFSNKVTGSTYLIGLLIGYGIGIPIGIELFAG